MPAQHQTHPHPALAPAAVCTRLTRHAQENPPGHASALEAADRLTREVVAATRDLAPSAASLGYALRESAVLAHAGTAAACREAARGRYRGAFAASDRCLRRLATWLDLAQRFGDLPAPTVLALLESLSRCRLELLVLAEATDTRNVSSNPPGSITLDVINAKRYGSS